MKKNKNDYIGFYIDSDIKKEFIEILDIKYISQTRFLRNMIIKYIKDNKEIKKIDLHWEDI